MDYKLTSIHKALGYIYVSIEANSKPMDVRDSRPRTIPEEVSTAYVNLIRALEKHYNVEEDSILLGARAYIREAIPLKGFSIGYADEGLSLAQMVTRASPTGYGVQYQSNIRYEG